MHKYNQSFFDYISKGSVKSANVVVPITMRLLDVESVLDVGCGAGAWLHVWKQHGVTEVVGIDSMDESFSGFLHESEFVRKDLTSKFDLNRRFDLVQCLEVAEHLPEESASSLVRSLVKHGDYVLFSAAQPGQGGEYHINEKTIGFWRQLFKEENYILFDAIRTRIIKDRDVEPWYRYNMLLYVNDNAMGDLHESLRACVVDEHDDVKEMRPFLYRIRCQIIDFLPTQFKNILVVWKRKMTLMLRRASEKL